MSDSSRLDTLTAAQVRERAAEFAAFSLATDMKPHVRDSYRRLATSYKKLAAARKIAEEQLTPHWNR
jgi:hypothetical protein